MNAPMLSSGDPFQGACRADPYTLTESMPVCKAMIERICTPAQRHEMIAKAAYYRAQRRGFVPGHELTDWLAAEHDINALCGLIEPHPSWDSPDRPVP